MNIQNTLKRIGRKLGFLFLLSMPAIVATIIVVMVLEDSPLSYQGIPFKMQSKKVALGDVASYVVIRCNNTKSTVTYIISQNLESLDDDYVTHLGDTRVSIKPGCHKDVDQFTRIPETIAPGHYRLIGKSEVKGSTRTHFLYWKTQPFEITGHE